MTDEKKEVKQPERAAAVANERVQDAVDAENEVGYRGDKADPTPNENYTIAGVTKGLPTPETDPDAAAAAGSTKFR